MMVVIGVTDPLYPRWVGGPVVQPKFQPVAGAMGAMLASSPLQEKTIQSPKEAF